MVKIATSVDPTTGTIRVGLLGRLRELLGDYSPVVRFYRHHKPRRLWGALNPVGRLTLRYVERHGLVVRHGPFRGMRYPGDAVGRSGYLVPKLVGTYERQLHPVFDRASDFETFVEIGSSDGYYCVAFALLNPGARVVGFETDQVERRIADQLAELNGVDIEIRGTAGATELNALPGRGLLLMMDIEGAERELLRPDLHPPLRTATILVETHVGVHADLADVLTERFAATHEIDAITADTVPPPVPAELTDLTPEESSLVLSEGRLGSNLWLLLAPRSS